MRASVHTLGCRLNQSESAIIHDRLRGDGYQLVPFGDTADLGVINTCTVTGQADQKCRQAIRGFIRRNPEAFTAVVGCYSQMGYQAIAEIPGVDLIIGNQSKLALLDYVKLGKNTAPLVIRDQFLRKDFTIEADGDEACSRRANLKIQDGCDFMCSFCVIPFARGRARSRSFDNLLEEARMLVQRGARELILTGVNVGTYDDAGRDIVAIVDALDAIENLQRVRISSIEPTTIPDGVLDRMRETDHALTPYLHVPMQSGSDHVLSIMKRRYTRGELLDFIDAAADHVPGLCIGTDILVGSPGEREEDFDATYAAFRDHPFAYAHTFTYSPREGTPAASRPEQVPEWIRRRRNAAIRRLSAKKRADYARRFLGQTMMVLFESRKNGPWPGYTANYIRVAVASDKNLENQIHRVRLTQYCADFVAAELVDPCQS